MKSNTPQKNIPNGWDMVPVGDVFTFIKSYAFSRDNLVNDTHNKDGIGNIHYGDIHSTFSTPSIDLKKVSVPMIKDATFVPKPEDLLKDGDLIMADASEDYAGVGVTVSLHGLEDKKVVGGLHTFVLRDTKNKTDKYFRQYIFRNPEIRNSMQKTANGVSVYGISKTAVAKILLPIPSLVEQKRIVVVLQAWEEAVGKLERKIELKQHIKKGITNQYVYNRKDSREYFIDDLFDLGRGRVISRGEIEANLGEYPVFSSQTSENGVFGKIKTYDFDGEYLTWTTDGANAGRVFYRKGRFNCTNVCGTAKLKAGQKVSLYFVGTYLNYVTKRYVSYVGNPKLMNNTFGIIEIKLPDYAEQEKISKILMTLDKEIEDLSKRLTLIKEQRKYILNNLLTGKIRTPEKLSTRN